MKKFVLMTLFLLVTLFSGTLLGIQHMQEEVGLSQPEPLIYEKEKGDYEKKRENTYELAHKKERMEQVESFNFFSDLGRLVAEGANDASRALLSQVMSFVHHVLNGE